MYKEYLPCHILAPYVDRYWEFKGQTEQGMQIKLSTDGCTDFMFILETTVNHGIIMQPYHSYFIGPTDIGSALITSAGTINTFGVRFRPCGLSRFMKTSLSELTNIRLSVNDLDTIFSDSFAERLFEEQGIQGKINLIERYLKEHLYKSSHTMDAQIAYAVNQINAHEGKISISHLMNEVNLCQRHFERKFKLHTGFTPQNYNSIVKFKNAIKILRNESSDNLLSVAVKAGYYDASHLSREVKKLSGSTPNFFLSLPPDNETTIIYTK